MKILLQRVRHARVDVDGKTVGEIQQGLLAFVGIEKQDDQSSAEKLLDKMLAYRVFADQQGKMNLSVADIDGGVLLVSQFTLAADTRKGLRPSFSSAAPPEQAKALYEHCVAYTEATHPTVAQGEFAADMQITLLNDGPVTFLLEG